METDKVIKSVLEKQANEIEATNTLWHKIRVDIYEKEHKKTMKKDKFRIGKKKKLVTTVALCMLIGSITVIGATLSKGWISHSYLKYRSLPTAERIQKDVGFLPKYVDELPGEFVFEYGSIGETSLNDEGGNKMTEAKEIAFSYINDSMNRKHPVFLNAMQIDKSYISNEESIWVANEDGIDFYYYEKMYKFVPPNYEQTEEDKRAYANGELEISVGAPEISVEQVQNLSWYEDGIHYSISANDYEFTVEEMLEMAKAVINQ